jgi:hypothetical protein
MLSSALEVDAVAIQRDIEQMRRRHPLETDERLARRCIRDAALCAGAASLALALPSHPALAIPAAIAEVVLLARLEAVTAARIAAVFQADALGERRDRKLVPLFGDDEGRDTGRALQLEAGRRACRSAIACLVLDPSRTVGRVLKHAGLGGCERRLVGRAIPVVGAVVGAIASARKVVREGERAVAYFGRVAGARQDAPAEKARPPVLRAVPAVALPDGVGPPRAPSAGLRAAAVQAIAAAIRASDALAVATHAPRRQVAKVLAEGRARARRLPVLAPAP